MKNYSWIVALLLALAMVFVFASCNDSSDDDDDSSSTTDDDDAGIVTVDAPQFTGYGDLSGTKNSFVFKRIQHGCGIEFALTGYTEYSKVKVYYTLAKLGTVYETKPMKIGFKIKKWGGSSDTYSGNSGYKESNTDASMDFEMNIALLTEGTIFIEHNTYVTAEDQSGSTDFTITITKLEFTP